MPDKRKRRSNRYGIRSRHRPRNHQQRDRRLGGRRSSHHRQRRRVQNHSVGGGIQGRGDPGGGGGQATGHHQPQPHCPVGQEADGYRLVHRGRSENLPRPGDRGPGAAQAQERRRGVPGGNGHRRGDHRSCLLQRRPAPSHQGSRGHRRIERAAHHQRAHRRFSRLRP